MHFEPHLCSSKRLKVLLHPTFVITCIFFYIFFRFKVFTQAYALITTTHINKTPILAITMPIPEMFVKTLNKSGYSCWPCWLSCAAAVQCTGCRGAATTDRDGKIQHATMPPSTRLPGSSQKSLWMRWHGISMVRRWVLVSPVT